MTQLLATDPTTQTDHATGELEATLVDLVDLSLQAEQAQWTYLGPGSKGIRSFLDQLIDQYRDWHDDLAERLRAIGDSSPERVAKLAAATPLQLLPAGDLRDRDVVAFLDDRITRLAERVRARMEPVGDFDPASQNLLAGIVAWLDQQGRILRVHPDHRAIRPIRAIRRRAASSRGGSADRQDSPAA